MRVRGGRLLGLGGFHSFGEEREGGCQLQLLGGSEWRQQALFVGEVCGDELVDQGDADLGSGGVVAEENNEQGRAPSLHR